MSRLDWDDYFLKMAEVAAERGTCNRLKVGCIITKNNRIISSGYNGSIDGHEHCTDIGCLLKEGRCIRTLHAEENALLYADQSKLAGATVYVTHEPCENCTKRLNQMGIARVFFSSAYPNEWNKHFIEPMVWIHQPKEEVPNLDT